MQTMPVVREPAAAELPRAAYLFRHAKLPADARFLVAVRLAPVERFIGAVDVSACGPWFLPSIPISWTYETEKTRPTDHQNFGI